MTDEEMNIYQRIDAAYKDIAKIKFEKTGTVEGSQHYKFIPIEQLLNAIRGAHARYGVKIVFGTPEYDPDQGEYRKEIREEREDRMSGRRYTSVMYYAVGHVHVRLIGSGPDDCIETDIGFEAKDSSDKLMNKVYTNAERCLLRTLYSIDEGSGDPEATNTENDVRDDVPQQPRRTDGHTKSANPKIANFFSPEPPKAEGRKTEKTAKAEKPAEDAPKEPKGKRIVAVSHLSADYKPLPEGSARNMGTDRTGRQPEADGLVHLRTAREQDEQTVMNAYFGPNGSIVEPYVTKYGKDVKTWTDDQVSEALGALVSADAVGRS